MNEPKIAHFEVQKIDCDQWSLGCCVSSQKWGRKPRDLSVYKLLQMECLNRSVPEIR